MVGFIGREFPTPKGGVITVIGVSDKKIGSHKRYICECSICSKDKELFPKPFECYKGNLIQGKIPCGCSKSRKWSRTQWEVIVKRECKSRSYIFLGFAGEYKGAQTKLLLENPATNNRWGTITIFSFMRGIGDPVAGREATRLGSTKPLEQHIQDFFMTGKFLKGTIFTPRADKKYHYDYICPKCSHDKYVKAGLCTGVFQGFIGHLKEGKLSCRCAANPAWTEKQREHQLKETCNKESLTFLGWETEYKRYTSYFLWLCKEGHRCKTSVDNFIRGNRCKTCAQLSNGVGNGNYPLRHNEPDHLYILALDSLFIKCGRSFNPSKRIKEIEKDSGHKIKLLYLFSEEHQDIYRIEQDIKCYMYSKGLNFYKKDENSWCGSTECYKYKALPLILEYISCQEGLASVEIDNN